MARTTRPWLLRGTAIGAVLLLTACGGSDEDPGTSATSNPEPTTMESTAGATAPEEPLSEPTPTDAAAPTTPAAPTTAAAATASVVRVSDGSVDPWEIDGTCQWTPDNTGAASSLWLVETTDDSKTEEITMIEAWPLGGEPDDEPVVLGSVVEPDGNLLVVIGAEASFDGTTITVLADVHAGLKTADDPPDYTLTVTCAP